MKWNRFWRSAISLLNLVCFVSVSVAGANPPLRSGEVPIKYLEPGLETLQFPEEFGKIEEKFNGTGKDLVILVQDAHCNFDAQTNIRKVIGALQNTYGLKLVALEGGAGELDLLPLKAFPDAAVKEKVLMEYASRGEISGAEMAAVLNPADSVYFAIEDRAIYQENRKAFLEVDRNKDSQQKTLDELRRNLDRIRDSLWPPELKELDNKFQSHDRQGDDLLDYVRYLHDKAKAMGVSSEPYPSVSNLIRQFELEKEFDRDGPGSMSQLALDFIHDAKDKIAPLVEGDQKAEFGSKAQAYQIGNISRLEFVKYLVRLADELGLKLENQDSLRKTLRGLSELSEAQAPQFFEELEDWTQALKEKLFRNEDERILDKLYRNLRILERLSHLEATRKEVAHYRSHKPEFTPAFSRDFLKKFGEAAEDFNFSAEERFYELALARDEVLFKNLRRVMGEKKISFAVAVAGGFHTEGLKQHLQREGISYAVVSPRIRDAGDEENYRRVMRGEISYRDTARLKKEMRYEIDRSDPRLVVEHLKQWRTAIINEALRKGKMAVAGEYTRYVDALFETLAAKTSGSAVAPEVAVAPEIRGPLINAVGIHFVLELARSKSLQDPSGEKSVGILVGEITARFKALVGPEVEVAKPTVEKIRNAVREDLARLQVNLPSLNARYQQKGEVTPEQFKAALWGNAQELGVLQKLVEQPKTLPEAAADDQDLITRLAAKKRDDLSMAMTEYAERVLGIKDAQVLAEFDGLFKAAKVDSDEKRLAILRQALQLKQSGKSVLPLSVKGLGAKASDQPLLLAASLGGEGTSLQQSSFSAATENYFRFKRDRVAPQQNFLFDGRKLDEDEERQRALQFQNALEQLTPEVQAQIAAGNNLVMGTGNHGQELTMLTASFPKMASLTGTDISQSNLSQLGNQAAQADGHFKMGEVPLTLLHSGITQPTPALTQRKYQAIYAGLIFRTDILDEEEWAPALQNLKNLLADNGVVFVRSSSPDDARRFESAGFIVRHVDKSPSQGLFLAALSGNVFGASLGTEIFDMYPVLEKLASLIGPDAENPEDRLLNQKAINTLKDFLIYQDPHGTFNRPDSALDLRNLVEALFSPHIDPRLVDAFMASKSTASLSEVLHSRNFTGQRGVLLGFYFADWLRNVAVDLEDGGVKSRYQIEGVGVKVATDHVTTRPDAVAFDKEEDRTYLVEFKSLQSVATHQALNDILRRQDIVRQMDRYIEVLLTDQDSATIYPESMFSTSPDGMIFGLSDRLVDASQPETEEWTIKNEIRNWFDRRVEIVRGKLKAKNIPVKDKFKKENNNPEMEVHFFPQPVLHDPRRFLMSQERAGKFGIDEEKWRKIAKKLREFVRTAPQLQRAPGVQPARQAAPFLEAGPRMTPEERIKKEAEDWADILRKPFKTESMDAIAQKTEDQLKADVVRLKTLLAATRYAGESRDLETRLPIHDYIHRMEEMLYEIVNEKAEELMRWYWTSPSREDPPSDPFSKRGKLRQELQNMWNAPLGHDTTWLRLTQDWLVKHGEESAEGASLGSMEIVNPGIHPKPKTILFDFHGTFVDVDEIQEKAFGHLYRWIILGKTDEPETIPREEIEPGIAFARETMAMGRLIREQITMLIGDALQTFNEKNLRDVLEKLAAQYQLSIDPKTIDLVTGFGKVYETYLLHEIDQNPPPLKEGVVEFLDHLHDSGIELAIGSGMLRSGVEQIMEYLGIRHYFKEIHGADAAGPNRYPNGKSDMVNASQADMVIGDSPVDMKAKEGRSGMGVAAVGLHNHKTEAEDALREAGADFLIPDLSKWKAYLGRLGLPPVIPEEILDRVYLRARQDAALKKQPIPAMQSIISALQQFNITVSEQELSDHLNRKNGYLAIDSKGVQQGKPVPSDQAEIILTGTSGRDDVVALGEARQAGAAARVPDLPIVHPEDAPDVQQAKIKAELGRFQNIFGEHWKKEMEDSAKNAAFLDSENILIAYQSTIALVIEQDEEGINTQGELTSEEWHALVNETVNKIPEEVEKARRFFELRGQPKQEVRQRLASEIRDLNEVYWKVALEGLDPAALSQTIGQAAGNQFEEWKQLMNQQIPREIAERHHSAAYLLEVFAGDEKAKLPDPAYRDPPALLKYVQDNVKRTMIEFLERSVIPDLRHPFVQREGNASEIAEAEKLKLMTAVFATFFDFPWGMEQKRSGARNEERNITGGYKALMFDPTVLNSNLKQMTPENVSDPQKKMDAHGIIDKITSVLDLFIGMYRRELDKNPDSQLARGILEKASEAKLYYEQNVRPKLETGSYLFDFNDGEETRERKKRTALAGFEKSFGSAILHIVQEKMEAHPEYGFNSAEWKYFLDEALSEDASKKAASNAFFEEQYDDRASLRQEKKNEVALRVKEMADQMRAKFQTMKNYVEAGMQTSGRNAERLLAEFMAQEYLQDRETDELFHMAMVLYYFIYWKNGRRTRAPPVVLFIPERHGIFTFNDWSQLQKQHPNIQATGEPQGGPTSHHSIDAAHKGIPAVTGVKGPKQFRLGDVPAGAKVMVDGTTGTIYVHPSLETRVRLYQLRDELNLMRRFFKERAPEHVHISGDRSYYFRIRDRLVTQPPLVWPALVFQTLFNVLYGSLRELFRWLLPKFRLNFVKPHGFYNLGDIANTDEMAPSSKKALLSAAEESGVSGGGLFRIENIFLEETREGIQRNLERMAKAFQAVMDSRFLAGRPEGALKGRMSFRLFDLQRDKIPEILLDTIKEKKKRDSFIEENPGAAFYLYRDDAGGRPFWDFGVMQIKALLLANRESENRGKMNIMFPRVDNEDQAREIWQMIRQAQREIGMSEAAFKANIKIGFMIESTEAIRNATILMKLCDFVSVGTNDLTESILKDKFTAEYLLAHPLYGTPDELPQELKDELENQLKYVNRTNPQYKEEFATLRPAMTKALWQIAQEAQRQGKPVAVCGELGGDPLMAFYVTAIRLKYGIEIYPVAGIISAPRQREYMRRVGKAELLNEIVPIFEKLEQKKALKENDLQGLQGMKARVSERIKTSEQFSEFARRHHAEAAATAASLGQSQVIRQHAHDQVLEPLRKRFREQGAPVPAVVNYDPHEDVGGWWQVWMPSGEGNWVRALLQEGLAKYYVQIPPVYKKLKNKNIRIWTSIPPSLFWPWKRVVELRGKDYEKALVEIKGKETAVTVDTDAYSLEEDNLVSFERVPYYHTAPAQFPSQSRPLLEFLRQHDLKPDPTIYLAESVGGGLASRWVDDRVDEAYLEALSGHLTAEFSKLEPMPAATGGSLGERPDRDRKQAGMSRRELLEMAGGLTIGGFAAYMFGRASLPAGAQEAKNLETLSRAEIAQRQELIWNNTKPFFNIRREGEKMIFEPGVLIDKAKKLPADWMTTSDGWKTVTTKTYTQPTAIGFYLELLAHVIDNDGFIGRQFQYSDNPKAFNEIQAQALVAAEDVLNQLLKAQDKFGFKGLIPWIDLGGEEISSDRDVISFLDNAKLSQSVAVFIGRLERMYDRYKKGEAAKLPAHQLATRFLDRQKEGYKAFYDVERRHPNLQFFRGEYFTDTKTFGSYYIDRMMAEHRAAMAFVITYFGMGKQGWRILHMPKKGELLTTSDGSLFQATWTLVSSHEATFPWMADELYNFLHAQASFVAGRNDTPGLLSAAYLPTGPYEGKIGAPAAAEYPQGLNTRVGSLQALLAAFPLQDMKKPILEWTRSVQEQIPAINTPYGLANSAFFDEQTGRYAVAPVITAVDNLAAVLGLLGGEAGAFTKFLERRGLLDDFNGLYEMKTKVADPAGNIFGVKRVQEAFPKPPRLKAETPREPARLAEFSLTDKTTVPVSGAMKFRAKQEFGEKGVRLTFSGFGDKDWRGFFFHFDRERNLSGGYLNLRYKGTLPSATKVELQGAFNRNIRSFDITTPSSQTERVISIRIEKDFAPVGIMALVWEKNKNLGAADFDFEILGGSYSQKPAGEVIATAQSLGMEERVLPSEEAEKIFGKTLLLLFDEAEKLKTREGHPLALKIFGGAIRTAVFKAYVDPQRNFGSYNSDVDGVLYDPLAPLDEIADALKGQFFRRVRDIANRDYQYLTPDYYDAVFGHEANLAVNRLTLEKIPEGYRLTGPQGWRDDLTGPRKTLRLYFPPDMKMDTSDEGIKLSMSAILPLYALAELLMPGVFEMDGKSREHIKGLFMQWKALPAPEKSQIAASVIDAMEQRASFEGVYDFIRSLTWLPFDPLEFYEGTPQKGMLKRNEIWREPRGASLPPPASSAGTATGASLGEKPVPGVPVLREQSQDITVPEQGTANVVLRVHGELPKDLQNLLAGLVGQLHREKQEESAQRGDANHVTNNCGVLSEYLADMVDTALGDGAADILGSPNLSKRHEDVPLPDHWKRPVGFGNHWVTYARAGNLHIVVDVTAKSYIKDKDIDAEILVASSRNELERKLMEYYGGNQWQTYAESHSSSEADEEHQFVINGAKVDLRNLKDREIQIEAVDANGKPWPVFSGKLTWYKLLAEEHSLFMILKIRDPGGRIKSEQVEFKTRPYTQEEMRDPFERDMADVRRIITRINVVGNQMEGESLGRGDEGADKKKRQKEWTPAQWESAVAAAASRIRARLGDPEAEIPTKDMAEELARAEEPALKRIVDPAGLRAAFRTVRRNTAGAPGGTLDLAAKYLKHETKQIPHWHSQKWKQVIRAAVAEEIAAGREPTPENVAAAIARNPAYGRPDFTGENLRQIAYDKKEKLAAKKKKDGQVDDADYIDLRGLGVWVEDQQEPWGREPLVRDVQAAVSYLDSQHGVMADAQDKPSYGTSEVAEAINAVRVAQKLPVRNVTDQNLRHSARRYEVDLREMRVRMARPGPRWSAEVWINKILEVVSFLNENGLEARTDVVAFFITKFMIDRIMKGEPIPEGFKEITIEDLLAAEQKHFPANFTDASSGQTREIRSLEDLGVVKRQMTPGWDSTQWAQAIDYAVREASSRDAEKHAGQEAWPMPTAVLAEIMSEDSFYTRHPELGPARMVSVRQLGQAIRLPKFRQKFRDLSEGWGVDRRISVAAKFSLDQTPEDNLSQHEKIADWQSETPEKIAMDTEFTEHLHDITRLFSDPQDQELLRRVMYEPGFGRLNMNEAEDARWRKISTVVAYLLNASEEGPRAGFSALLSRGLDAIQKAAEGKAEGASLGTIRKISLKERIIRRIGETGGKIPFTKFQWLSLYAPVTDTEEGGYYTSGGARFSTLGSPHTDGKTFTTSSMIPSTGIALARQAYSFWEEMGKPDIFDLVEQGGGDGTLALNILNTIIKERPDFYPHVRYKILDASPALSERQREKLTAAGHAQVDYRVGSATKMPFDDSSIEGLFISNELPDAFPVHRVVVRGGKLREVYVKYEEGRFLEEEGEISDPLIYEYFEIVGELPPEGKEIAVNLDLFDWVKELVRVLRRGFVITADYGYEKTKIRYQSTHKEAVWTLTQNKTVLDPGIDTTHNVDFETLRKIGERFGLNKEDTRLFSRYLNLFALVVWTANEEEFVLVQSKGMVAAETPEASSLGDNDADRSAHTQLFRSAKEFIKARTKQPWESIVRGKILNIGLETDYRGNLENKNLVTYLRGQGMDVDGLDPHPDLKTIFPQDYFKQGSVQAIPADDNQYDTVLSFGLFNLEFFHMSQIRKEGFTSPHDFYSKAAAEIGRILKPDGWFVVTTGVAEVNSDFLAAFREAGFETVALSTRGGVYLMQNKKQVEIKRITGASLGAGMNYEKIEEPMPWLEAKEHYLKLSTVRGQVGGFAFLPKKRFEKIVRQEDPLSYLVVDLLRPGNKEDKQEIELLLNFVRTSPAHTQKQSRILSDPATRYQLYQITPDEADEEPFIVFVYDAPKAQSLGRQEDFNDFVLGLVAEKYALDIPLRKLGEDEIKRALQFFFEAGTDRKKLLDDLEAYLVKALADPSLLSGLRMTPANASNFESLARRILFEGLGENKAAVIQALKSFNPKLTEGQVNNFLADLEGVLGTAAVASFAKNRDEKIMNAMKASPGTPEEYERAFNQLAKEKGLEITSNNNLAVAVHITSIPQDLSEADFRAMVKRVGEGGQLFLVFSRESAEDQKNVNRFLSFLTREEKNRVSRLPYVGPLPVAEIGRQLSKIKEARKIMIMNLEYLKEVGEKIMQMKGGRETALFEYDGKTPSFLAGPILSLIISDSEADALFKQFPDIVKKENLGNGFFFVSFDLQAFITLLNDRIAAERELQKAA